VNCASFPFQDTADDGDDSDELDELFCPEEGGVLRVQGHERKFTSLFALTR
jgi:hypothetical protein